MIGTVRIVGNAPLEQVLIEPADGAAASLEVRGQYTVELRNLAGAKMRVVGTLQDERLFDVSEYEVLEIGGHVPLVGVLSMNGESYTLRVLGAEAVPLKKSPARFRELNGAKLWVVIDASGAVEAYGIIRER